MDFRVTPPESSACSACVTRARVTPIFLASSAPDMLRALRTVRSQPSGGVVRPATVLAALLTMLRYCCWAVVLTLICQLIYLRNWPSSILIYIHNMRYCKLIYIQIYPNLVIYKYTTTPVPAVNPAPHTRFPNGTHGRSRFGHRDPGRDLERGAEHSSDRPRAGAVGRLVHRHGARARQPDRQLRRDRRGRSVGRRSRPRQGKTGARRSRAGRCDGRLVREFASTLAHGL